MSDSTWFPHPELIQTTTITAEQGKRFFIHGGACYLLYARCSQLNGSSGLTATLFTTEDPDAEAADVDLCSLDQGNYRGHDDAPDTYFEFGIYAKIDGPTAAEECKVEVAFVKRQDYCRAYHRAQSFLKKCWDAACGREGTPWLSNFDPGQDDVGEWANSGVASGSGGSGPGEYLDTVFRILDDGDDTKKIAFQASAITTGTTRTITMPDADVDLGSLGGGDEFADDVFRVQDNSDATKEIAFEASNITTGTTRTITVPDVNLDLGIITLDNFVYGHNETAWINKGALGVWLPADMTITSVKVRWSKAITSTSSNYWELEAYYTPSTGSTPTLLQSANDNTSIGTGNYMWGNGVDAEASVVHRVYTLSIDQNLDRDKDDMIFIAWTKNGSPVSMSSNSACIQVTGTRR